MSPIKMYLDVPELKALPGKGSIPADVMVVGLASSLNSSRGWELEPMDAKDRAILNYFQSKVSEANKTLYVTNLVKTPQSSQKKVKISEIRYWLPVLEVEIKRVNPRRIITFGEQTAKALIPHFKSLRSDHGTFFTHASPIEDHGASLCYIIPTYDFLAGFSDPMKQPLITNDLKRAFSLPDPQPASYKMVDDMSQVNLPEHGEVMLDLETTGLDLNDSITRWGIGWRDDDNFQNYLHLKPTGSQIAAFIQQVNLKSVKLFFHNGAFDLMMLKRWSSVPFQLVRTPGDTMLGAHVKGQHMIGLKHLTSMHTDLPGSHSGGSFEDPQYLAEDIVSTDAVRHRFIEVETTPAYKLLTGLVPAIVDMRLNGVFLDRDRLIKINAAKNEELIKLDTRLHHLYSQAAEINWNSPQQVIAFFLSIGINLTKKTDSGNYSVAEDVLLELEKTLSPDTKPQQMTSIVLERRALQKLISSFLTSFLELMDHEGLVHPNLRLHGTSTGRISCRKPNIQQIPREGEFKLCFKSRWSDGYYGLVDLAQAELRVAALISGDEQFAEALNEGDIHAHMAKLAFPNIIDPELTLKEVKELFPTYRKASKSTTFGLVYGGSPKGLATRNNLELEHVLSVMAALEKFCPRLMNWLTKTKERSLSTLETGTLFGNMRDLTPEFHYEGPGGVKRKGINTPIQGVASYLALMILSSLYYSMRKEGLKSIPIFTVHDSVMLEVIKDEIERVRVLTQQAFESLVDSPLARLPLFKSLPIKGDLVIGDTWAHVEETNEHYHPRSSTPCFSHKPR